MYGSKSFQKFVSIGSALIDVPSLHEQTHVFENFEMFFRGKRGELIGVVMEEGSNEIEFRLAPCA
mgnify:CR=1 FL=1